ncbi:hypothetical protein SS50377_22676 [Spironucleus salmonicida]|uniref:Uncharacterized protein n=1 Tax=Spironucleus salmonicida TaxID=348837 RepID=V6LZ32_9EUKA|nr:hypothetical protein SS50377_22676 [Spironucleus salmonicida]|eukprot:EST48996.1 Hypothetical protein SS50377_10766 [Spironucleus salmonicida]
MDPNSNDSQTNFMKLLLKPEEIPILDKFNIKEFLTKNGIEMKEDQMKHALSAFEAVCKQSMAPTANE